MLGIILLIIFKHKNMLKIFNLPGLKFNIFSLLMAVITVTGCTSNSNNLQSDSPSEQDDMISYHQSNFSVHPQAREYAKKVLQYDDYALEKVKNFIRQEDIMSAYGIVNTYGDIQYEIKEEMKYEILRLIPTLEKEQANATEQCLSAMEEYSQSDVAHVDSIVIGRAGGGSSPLTINEFTQHVERVAPQKQFFINSCEIHTE